MSGFIAVGYFLICLIFDIFLFALWSRAAMRYLHFSSLNPFSRLIYSLTNPVIEPICKLARYQYRAQQQYDWPTLTVIVFTELFKITLLSITVFHTTLPIEFLMLYVLADFIIQPCNLLFYAVLIRIIMSYTNSNWRHPIVNFLTLLTQPLLILGRKIIPDISGFDFSPLIVMLILKVIILFVQASLPLHLL